MLFKREKTSCGIDLTSPSIPWVILRQQSRQLSLQAIGEGLQVIHAKKIYTVVANHQIMAKEITLPVAMSDADIEDYLQLLSSEVFMLSPELLVFDFYSLPDNHIKAYATRKNDIIKQQSLLQNYQIKANSIEPEQHALLRVYRFHNLTHELSLFIHCCHDHLQLYVIEQDEIIFYHQFICEHHADAITITARLQEAWHHYHGKTPGQVFISGDYRQEIMRSGQHFFNTKIQLFNPFKKMDEKLNHGKFTLAIGLALRGCHVKH
ncbi:MAG: hypothetical protein AAGA27_07090 [Pseudomonadota bacterium]